jgi:hypothetical protein
VLKLDLNKCSDITEIWYMAMHPEEQEEKMMFDVSFLLNLVPSEKEWILSLGVINE